MWSTRIAEAVRRAGATAVSLGTDGELVVALEAHELADEVSLAGAIVDLAGRRFDGVAAIARIHDARLPVMAVAQHDDQVTRRRALAAGASRVFSYQKFSTDGTRLVEGWLAAAAPRPVDPAAAPRTGGQTTAPARTEAAS
jgi:DNA-binding NarL/FixJ family response regulator